MVLTIVLGVVGFWLLASVLLALVIGRAIKIANRDHGSKIAYRAASAPIRARAAS